MVRKIKNKDENNAAANGVFERMTIKIKGEDIVCLRPAAVDIMRAEDLMMNTDGTVNLYAYQRELLRLVTKRFKIEDLVENTGEVVFGLDMSSIPYSVWLESGPMGRMKNGTGRIDTVETVLSILDKDKNIDIRTLDRDTIDEIYAGFLGAYNADEVFGVIEDIYTFCFPGNKGEDSEASI